MEEYELLSLDDEFPEALSSKEETDLLIKMAAGDMNARTKLINYNMRLVAFIVKNYFDTVEYDKKELEAIGMPGLIRGIDTYDISKNIKLSTYASRCISNEILMFVRKLKNIQKEDSLQEIIRDNDQGKELTLEGLIASPDNLEEDLLRREIILKIRECIAKLSKIDQEIVDLFFFKQLKQYEVATALSITQATVSRRIDKILKLVAIELEREGYIELNSKQKAKIYKK